MENVQPRYDVKDVKSRLSSILGEVESRGVSVIVTKHGKPFAKIVPLEIPDLRGSVKIMVPDDELIKPIDMEWSAEQL